MLGFRFDPPGPFWFEDLVFFVIDESRRLPARTVKAASAAVRVARNAHDALVAWPDRVVDAVRTKLSRPLPPPVVARTEVAPLEGPETWALATEPLVAVGTGTATAIALHKAAGEQLDALTYVLDRMREELRPVMTYARFKDDEIHHLETVAKLEVSIEALLELSRQNAATRPKDRVCPAA